MKKINIYLPRLITAILIILLVLASFTACKQNPDSMSSLSSEPSSAETTASSLNTLSSEDPIESEETPATASQSTPPPASTPSVQSSEPASSAPEPVVSSEPEPEPEPEPPTQKTPQELIIGKWEGYYDVASEFAELGFTVDGNSKIKAEMEFTPSGSVITAFDEATFKNLMRPILAQTMEELKKQVMEEKNMTSEEYDAAFLQDYGMTISAYIDEALTIYDDLTETSEYKFAGDVLLIKDTLTSKFVESEYSFSDDNTLITIEDGIKTIYTRIS